MVTFQRVRRHNRPNTKKTSNSRLLFCSVVVFTIWIWCSSQYLDLSAVVLDVANQAGGDDRRTTSTTSTFSPVPIGRLPKPKQESSITATFNGLPLRLQKGPIPRGSFECQTPPVHQEEAWKVRSCQYENLCFDTITGEFTLAIPQAAPPPPHVSIGGINPRWMVDRHKPDRNESKLMWHPSTELQQPTPSSFYQLEPHVLLLPFHSMAAHNVGHLLWDDVLGLFGLLRNWFGRRVDEHQLLPLRVVLSQQQPLYASCDIRRNKRMQCTENLRRWMAPLLSYFGNSNSGGRVRTMNITSTKRPQLIVGHAPDQSTSGSSASSADLSRPQPTVVCAARALAGLGFWTDHGLSDHGWDAEQRPSHNMGRGALLYEWSSLSQPPPEPSQLPPQFRITLSIHSTRDNSRAWDDWERYRDVLQRTFSSSYPGHDIIIEAIEMKTLSIEEQIGLAQRTDVWITMCGGGAVTAAWLPRHAALIVLYSPTAGLDFATLHSVDRPTRLDADLWNHASYLHVHWIPWVKQAEDASATTATSVIVGALVEHEYSSWINRRGQLR